MKLGMFMMPLHHPDKPWDRALAEDREAVILADRLGFSEVWIGEHFSSKAEQIPSPMMFLASVLDAAKTIRFGTGVINLPHHNPIIVAAEAAMFDHLSGGRLMLGIGPGGLPSDAEMFGGREVAERYPMAMESLDIILQLWTADAPFKIEGKSWEIGLEKQIWPHAGVGVLTRPLQKPHPPIAMAMMGPGGRTAEIIAERDCIPISGNMVPLEIVAAQWTAYAAARDKLNKPADPDIWRVCRNILVTDSEEQARDALADPEGTLSYYFRYIRGVRRIAELREFGHDRSLSEIDRLLGVAEALDDCAIVGTADQVLDRLIAVVDKVGRFGSLIMIGHDWDQTNLWQSSMQQLATKVMPKLSQHASVVATPLAG
jgi:alkanesulfonate monooxygenase SsuD/methylene tetrahydromethanopterin reductase-like flavin-dependent oxidoreductase (luciferase family)